MIAKCSFRDGTSKSKQIHRRIDVFAVNCLFYRRRWIMSVAKVHASECGCECECECECEYSALILGQFI